MRGFFKCINYTIFYVDFIRRKTSFKGFSMAAPLKTFIFLDCETTGLPCLEKFPTKITELTFTAVLAEHIKLGVFPRVHNKLHLCFNPLKNISKKAAEITKLSNDLLESQLPFNVATVNLINDFINFYPKPVCFVAHNGFKFDYPILKSEITQCGGNLPEGILCADSLEAFRHFHFEDNSVQEPVKINDNEIPFELIDDYDEILVEAVASFENVNYKSKPIVKKYSQEEIESTPEKQTENQMTRLHKKPNRVHHKINNLHVRRRLYNPGVSFKLKDVFERITGKPLIDAHSAQCDVDALITIIATFGERFSNWADQNSKKFADIPLLQTEI